MNYKITIQKFEPNPLYLSEDKRKEYGRYTNEQLTPEVIRDALSCELTDEQFKKVKAECLKVFE